MTNKTYGPDKLTVDQMYSNRQAAMDAGHRFYFTGKACKKGHLEPKYISGGCVECQRLRHIQIHKFSTRILLTPEEKIERRKEYYLANRERILNQRKANREEIKEQRNRYWQENKEVLSQKNKAYYQAKKDKIAESNKEYYEKNREKIRQRKRDYYLKNSEEIKQEKRAYRQKSMQKKHG